MYAGRRGRRPLPCLTHVHTLRPVHTHGRARRPRRAAPTGRPSRRPWNAHGDATCTRAAEDVGPYHASRPVHTPRPDHTHGRARRPRRAAPTGRPWNAHGTPRVRGPPRTSAPTMPHPCPHPTSCRHHMVGRDVLGAPRPRDAHGTPTGTPRVRGPPRTSAPTMPHVLSVPTGTPRVRGPPAPTTPHPCLHPHARSTPHVLSAPHGRARRPRRAAHTGRPWNAHGDATCTRAAEDVGPYHASRPVHTPRPVHTHGRARRPRRAAHTGRPWNAHGNATCTRAAGDVGPYHASPMSTPHALSTPMVGRDVLGAPRPLDAHGNAHGNATCTRAAEDVGPYHAPPMITPPRPVHAPRPIGTTW